eukprot:11157285-Alexandrium_andersonii.AAC.1
MADSSDGEGRSAQERLVQVLSQPSLGEHCTADTDCFFAGAPHREVVSRRSSGDALCSESRAR